MLKPGGKAYMSFSNRCFPTKGEITAGQMLTNSPSQPSRLHKISFVAAHIKLCNWGICIYMTAVEDVAIAKLHHHADLAPFRFPDMQLLLCGQLLVMRITSGLLARTFTTRYKEGTQNHSVETSHQKRDCSESRIQCM